MSRLESDHDANFWARNRVPEKSKYTISFLGASWLSNESSEASTSPAPPWWVAPCLSPLSSVQDTYRTVQYGWFQLWRILSVRHPMSVSVTSRLLCKRATHHSRILQEAFLLRGLLETAFNVTHSTCCSPCQNSTTVVGSRRNRGSSMAYHSIIVYAIIGYDILATFSVTL
jgi:hypothetical protein